MFIIACDEKFHIFSGSFLPSNFGGLLSDNSNMWMPQSWTGYYSLAAGTHTVAVSWCFIFYLNCFVFMCFSINILSLWTWWDCDKNHNMWKSCEKTIISKSFCGETVGLLSCGGETTWLVAGKTTCLVAGKQHGL